MRRNQPQNNSLALPYRRYSVLLSELPGINRRTLSRIVGHLRAVARQAERNLMPNYNLAAIWGPTLLTVDVMVRNCPISYGLPHYH